MSVLIGLPWKRGFYSQQDSPGKINVKLRNNICGAECGFKLTSFAKHHSFAITGTKPQLLRSHPSRKTAVCHLFSSYHSKESSLSHQTPSFSCWFARFCALLSGRMLSCPSPATTLPFDTPPLPPSKWEQTDVTQGQMVRFTTQDLRPFLLSRGAWQYRRCLFLQQICIYCLQGHFDFIQLLPPIGPGREPAFLFTLTSDIQKVMHANVSFIPFVQIKHLAVLS